MKSKDETLMISQIVILMKKHTTPQLCNIKKPSISLEKVKYKFANPKEYSCEVLSFFLL